MISASPELVTRLDDAVRVGSVDGITAGVKAVLEDMLSRHAVVVPEHFREARPDTYARRLLHRDGQGRYTAIVMTWGPGQGTPIHDHGGLWCVEGVVEGEIEVTQYDVTPADGRFRIEAQEKIRAGVGTAGRLIPPTDYHVIANAVPDAPSLTLHVYGGDLEQCRIFTPSGPDGWYTSETRTLAFHD